MNGNSELMAQAERRMQRIAQTFNADACHNADRIMRLPGTINVLGKTKVRAGRSRAVAALVEFHEDRIYHLEDFPEPDGPPSRPNDRGTRSQSRDFNG